MSSLPETSGDAAAWVVELDEGLALLNGLDNATVTLWSDAGSTLIGLGSLTTPVGGSYLDGKLYVACFGSIPLRGNSGLAVIDVAGRRLESTHLFPDNRFHVHNAFAFEFGGQKEILAAVVGNPWVGPVAGKGLSLFNRSTGSYDLETTSAELNARSAKQQADGSIFVLTQEPSPQSTKLARLEEVDGHLVVVAQTTLPPRPDGGDGGADVLLGVEKDTMWVTDRQHTQRGRLFYYTYASGAFQMVIERPTGVVPRYTVALENGDIVTCNEGDNDLTVYPGLALRPTDMSILEHRIPTVSETLFFIQTDKIGASTAVIMV